MFKNFLGVGAEKTHEQLQHQGLPNVTEDGLITALWALAFLDLIVAELVPHEVVGLCGIEIRVACSRKNGSCLSFCCRTDNINACKLVC
jgi:hypothetical protein